MVRRRRHPMFKGRHFDEDMIILCVRWYVTYKLSYRDLAAMMLERGISVAPSTIFRWVQRYVPEFEKRWNRFSRPVGWSWGHGALTRPTSRSRVSGATCIERSTSGDVPSTFSCVKTAASLRPKRSSGRRSPLTRIAHPKRSRLMGTGRATGRCGCCDASILHGGACTCERARISTTSSSKTTEPLRHAVSRCAGSSRSRQPRPPLRGLSSRTAYASGSLSVSPTIDVSHSIFVASGTRRSWSEQRARTENVLIPLRRRRILNPRLQRNLPNTARSQPYFDQLVAPFRRLLRDSFSITGSRSKSDHMRLSPDGTRACARYQMPPIELLRTTPSLRILDRPLTT
jgi:hypothetical protein